MENMENEEIVILGLCQTCGEQYVKRSIREMHNGCQASTSPSDIPIAQSDPAQPS